MGRIIQKGVILRNHEDETLANRGFLKPEEVRQLTLDMIVDTGAFHVSLPQALVDQLGLPLIRDDLATMADNRKVPVKVHNDLTVIIGDRSSIVKCLAKPSSPNLLGVLVLEDINYIIDPRNECIIPNPNAEPGMVGYEEFHEQD